MEKILCKYFFKISDKNTGGDVRDLHFHRLGWLEGGGFRLYLHIFWVTRYLGKSWFWPEHDLTNISKKSYFRIIVSGALNLLLSNTGERVSFEVLLDLLHFSSIVQLLKTKTGWKRASRLLSRLFNIDKFLSILSRITISNVPLVWMSFWRLPGGPLGRIGVHLATEKSELKEARLSRCRIYRVMCANIFETIIKNMSSITPGLTKQKFVNFTFSLTVVTVSKLFESPRGPPEGWEFSCCGSQKILPVIKSNHNTGLISSNSLGGMVRMKAFRVCE